MIPISRESVQSILGLLDAYMARLKCERDAVVAAGEDEEDLDWEIAGVSYGRQRLSELLEAHQP